jgi:hypothetical protein
MRGPFSKVPDGCSTRNGRAIFHLRETGDFSHSGLPNLGNIPWISSKLPCHRENASPAVKDDETGLATVTQNSDCTQAAFIR